MCLYFIFLDSLIKFRGLKFSPNSSQLDQIMAPKSFMTSGTQLSAKGPVLPLLAVAPPLPYAAAPASPPRRRARLAPCRAGRTPTSCYPSAFPSLSLALFPSRSASPPPAVPVCGNPAPAPPRHSLAAVPLVELPERADELPRRRRGPHLRRRGRSGRAGSTTTPTSSSPSRCSRTATRRCRRRLPSGGRPAARLASASASRSRFVILSRSSLHLLMALKFVATPSFKILVLKQLALALADDLWSIFGQFIAPNS